VPRILFVVTGADHWTLTDGSIHPTGFWAEELVVPHRLFRAAGFEVALATPGAVRPTVDQASLAAQANGGQERADEIAALLRAVGPDLAASLDLRDVDASEYDAIFYPGGHGPMEDLAVNEDSGRLMTAALDAGQPLGVLCHAPAAMLAAHRGDGSWPFAGYRMTAFSNAEERAAGLAAKAPWLLQDRLIALGADYSAGAPFAAYTVTDRSLHTGQNPASSAQLAHAVIADLGARV
jgi:aldehyde dehydrogenase (NAD+)